VKSSSTITPNDDDECYVWSFDQRDIDNPTPTAFTRLLYAERVKAILSLVTSLVPAAGRIADVGCAQGNVALLLAERGFVVDAFDLNASFLNYSRQKYETGQIRWLQGNIFDDSALSKGTTYNAVILGEIVEHVAHPGDLIAKALDLVSPGGVVIVTTPNGEYVRSRLPSYGDIIRSGDLPRIEREQFGPGGEHHLFAYSRRELLADIPSTGSLVRITYLGSGLFNSHVQPLLDSPVGGAYAALASFVPRVPGIRRKLAQTLVLVVRRQPQMER